MRGLWIVTLLGCLCVASLAIAAPPLPRHVEAQAVTTPNTVRPKLDRPNIVAPPIDQSAEQAPPKSDAIRPGVVRKIVLDPGHGGTNEGAQGVARIHEKHLTLQVALLVADRLRKLMPETEIILTRQRDTTLSLAQRIDIANRLEADLFVSIHFNNSNNPEAIGFESFWVGQFWEADMIRDGQAITDEVRAQRERNAILSEQMAQSFNRAMRHRFDVLDRGVKPGDYTVLTRAKVPAVVLETGFLSHAQEGLSLITTHHRQKLVDALVDAIRHYAQ